MSKSIFLSYARNDDEPFVARLQADLTVRGFDVWWDRIAMPARGLTFLQEIRDSIDSRDRFLIVLGPKAITSDYVVAEWQHAIIYGKAINPVLRLGDFTLLPEELKLLHVEDFRDDVRYVFHFENLVRQLSEPVPQMGKLIGVPSLPHHVLSRSIQSLKDVLLADLQRPLVVTGTSARTGVHGMGGIGKSVLANLLARDIVVRRAFSDGIIWIQLGTAPNLVELQRNVSKFFLDYGLIENVSEGRAKIADLLTARAVLLVLDDVWDRAHAEAFDVLGPRCRAIITTRDAGLVASLGAAQHQVSFLTEAESLDFLSRATNVNPTQLPSEAKEIAAECGYLFLALALCAGMIRRGATWSSILKRLQRAALESIADRNAENLLHRSIWAAMKVSVDSLARDEQRRFIELSVFPNDEIVPETAVRTLWSHTGGLDEFASEDLLLSFSERSLVRLDAEQTGQVLHRRISLHDLLYDFATKLAGGPVVLHAQLLDAYRTKCSETWLTVTPDGAAGYPKESPEVASGYGKPTTHDLTLWNAHRNFGQRYFNQTHGRLWHTVPADGYIHCRLGWHLEQAGQIEDLHRLLSEETAEGRNGWFEVNERLGQPENFEKNVRQAWNMVLRRCSTDAVTAGMGLQCRYALITASLNSLRAKIPRSLHQALVRQGLWSVQQALACARRTPNEEEKPAVLVAVGLLLPPIERNALLKEALAAVRTIRDEVHRSQALDAVLPHLPAELLSDVIAIIRAIGSEASRSRLLGKLAAQLPDQEGTPLSAEALLAARAIEWKASRVFVLAALTRKLPEQKRATVLAEALVVARAASGTSGNHGASALAELAPLLPERDRRVVLSEALTIARAAARSYYYGGGRTVFQAGGLVDVARVLPTDMLAEAMAATHALDEEHLSQVLIAVAPRLPPGLLAEALNAARACKDHQCRSRALAALAQQLSEKEQVAVLAEAVAAACAVTDEASRSTLLVELAPRLSPRLLAEVLAEGRTYKDHGRRFRLLITLAQHMEDNERFTVIAEALTDARAVGLAWPYLCDFAELVPHLPENERNRVLTEALAIARVIADPEESWVALAALAQELPEEDRAAVLADSLRAVGSIRSHEKRARALTALARQVSSENRPAILVDALAAARSVGNDNSRAETLEALAHQLPGKERFAVLAEALEVVRPIENEWRVVNLVSRVAKMAPDLPKQVCSSLLDLTLAAARKFGDPECRASALASVAALLPEQEQRAVSSEALTAASAISNEEFRRHKLVQLVPQLPPDLLPETLRVAITFYSDDYRAQVLVALAACLPPDLLPQALAAARAIRDTDHRARVLATLAQRLPTHDDSAVLLESLTTGSGFTAVMAAVPWLPSESLNEVLAIARNLEKPKDRCQALTAVAARLPERERSAVLVEALSAACAVDFEWDRSTALGTLAPQLSPPLLAEALTAACTIENREYRRQALVSLTPYLLEKESRSVCAGILSDANEMAPGELSKVLAALAPQLPTELLAESLKIACSLSGDAREDALAALVQRMAGVPRSELSNLWTIPVFAAGKRSTVLIELRRFTPILAALAGENAAAELREVARAITDVTRWWP
jgi:hypothetical protein